MPRRVLVGSTALGALLGSVFAARRRYLRWGATEDEVRSVLAGDDLVPHADLVSTRAIAVAARVEEVWPWLVQIGQARGGFYSYDALENLFGCDIHSADDVVEKWQHLAVGDEVKLAPEVALNVAMVEPPRALVLRGGVPMGAAPPPFDFSWAFVLRDGPGGGTRVVVRERYAYTQRWASMLVEPVQAVSFLMSEKMLRGIRDRAERRTRRQV